MTPLSSMLTTSRCSRARLDERRVDRLDPARVDDGDADALRDQPVGDLDRGRRPSRRRRRSARPWRRCGRARRARRPCRPPAMSSGGGPLGNRRTVGASSTSTASRSSSRSRVASRGAASRRPGHHLEDRHVPHAVVAGAVVAGDAGAVEHEGDAAPVQRDVHQHLVEGAVEERRVDRDHRVQAAHRQAGRRRRGVLLGDADVEGALGEAGRRTGAARPGASSPR